jgi:AcrR family transcriptional regulator
MAPSRSDRMLAERAPEHPPTAAPETRSARRKRETEARLLDAALHVFCEHGYDAATTGEMARVADVAAGTFYLHFRDKRAVYERLARRAAHDLLEHWRAAIPAGTSRDGRVRLALGLAAQFWREDPDRSRLLLEGGPSLGSEGHLRFVDEIAAIVAEAPEAPDDVAAARPHALLIAGLGIELGRLIVGRRASPGEPDGSDEIAHLVDLVCPAVA